MRGGSVLHAVALAVAGAVCLHLATESLACNETVCASLVSKCLLLDACECAGGPSRSGAGQQEGGAAETSPAINGSCYKTCYKCLHALYTECCSCVGMCPAQASDPDDDSAGAPSSRSSVEDLREPIPDLFAVLTEEQDPRLRWVSFSFPAHRDIGFFKPKPSPDGENTTGGAAPATTHFEFSVADPSAGGEVKKFAIEAGRGFQDINCTVAYMSQCMSMAKCKLSCSSMGASKYRWFHDGCCECVGHTCYNYGINRSQCLECGGEEGEDGDGAEEEEEYTDDYQDYSSAVDEPPSPHAESPEEQDPVVENKKRRKKKHHHHHDHHHKEDAATAAEHAKKAAGAAVSDSTAE